MTAQPRRLPPPPNGAAAPGPRRTRSRGQSLAEFALLLPLLIAFLGMTLDFARVYQAWMTLESSTRDAAEAAATSATSTANALAIAQRAVCLQSQDLPGFARSGLPSPDDIEKCASPNVAVIAFNLSTTSPGASPLYPIGSVTVEGRLPFTPLFPYPLITQNGTWTIVTRASFSIIQGRK